MEIERLGQLREVIVKELSVDLALDGKVMPCPTISWSTAFRSKVMDFVR
jgi:hypothetical protein